MAIQVKCLCRHVNAAPEDRVGQTIVCDKCGRNLPVRAPGGMSRATLKALRREHPELHGRASLGENLKAWLTENVAAHKGRDLAILLGLLLVVMVVWIVVKIGGIALTDAYDQEPYTTEDIRTQHRADREYRESQARRSGGNRTGDATGETSPAAKPLAAAQLLGQAKRIIDDRARTSQAKSLLKEITRRYPTSYEAVQATIYLRKIAAREEQR